MNLNRSILSFFKEFGKNPTKEQRKSFVSSPNYSNDSFQNMEEIIKQKVPIREIRRIKSNKSVPVKIPSQKSDLKLFDKNGVGIIWFGHSTYLVKCGEMNILVDPVLRNAISPLPNYIKAYNGTDVYHASDLPEIDILIITHDHFDHMDYKSLMEIKPIVKNVIVPLGVSSHLEYWGYEKQIITELNWYDHKEFTNGIRVIATPARHFSGRNLFRNKTLWASFVLIIGEAHLFISGDGGYGKHFKEIGDKYGPFDLALLENGQYSDYWRNSHVFPVEISKIMEELDAKMLFPIHWGKFALSDHEWAAPIVDLLATNPGFALTIPQIGEIYNLGEPAKNDHWWERA